MDDLTPAPVAWRWGIPGLKGYIHWRYSLNKTKDHAEPLYVVLPRLTALPERQVDVIIEKMFRFPQDFTKQQIRFFAQTIQYNMERINRG
jgi:hypothetical protein